MHSGGFVIQKFGPLLADEVPFWYNAAMILKRLLLYSLLLVLSTGYVLAGKPSKQDLLLKEVETKYAQLKTASMDVSKELTLAVLKKTKKSSGQLRLASKGKFRLDILEPTKSVVAMNGKDIWVAEYPDPEFKDDKIQVLHSKFKDQLKSQVLLSFLMGQSNLQKHFKISKKEAKDDSVKYTLVPKNKNVDLKTVTLTISSEEKEIEAISYLDNLDNEIKYVFKNKKFNEGMDQKIFDFKLPKNAEVSEVN